MLESVIRIQRITHKGPRTTVPKDLKPVLKYGFPVQVQPTLLRNHYLHDSRITPTLPCLSHYRETPQKLAAAEQLLAVHVFTAFSAVDISLKHKEPRRRSSERKPNQAA